MEIQFRDHVTLFLLLSARIFRREGEGEKRDSSNSIVMTSLLTRRSGIRLRNVFPGEIVEGEGGGEV